MVLEARSLRSGVSERALPGLQTPVISLCPEVAEREREDGSSLSSPPAGVLILSGGPHLHDLLSP